MKFTNKQKTTALAALLILAMLVQMLNIINSQSPVLDEQFYPGAGKYTLTNGDFSPFAYRFHPPLAYYINSLFLYTDGDQVWKQKPFDMGALYTHYGFDKYLFLTRLPIALVAIGAGALIFIWARKLYGDKPALLSLALFAFEPTIIANSSVATTDIVATTACLLFFYALWNYTKNKTARNAAIAGFSLGLALLSKFTLLLLVPLAAVLLVYNIRPFRKYARDFAILFSMTAFTVWAFYGFQFGTVNSAVHSMERADEFIGQALGPPIRDVAKAAMNIPVPAPSFFSALGLNFYHSYTGHGSYLLGEYSMHGWLHYYIVAFLLKSTIPMILLSIILALAFVSGRIHVGKEEKFLIVPIAAFFIVLSVFKLNIGLRHLLLVYPFIFILVGKLFQARLGKKYTKTLTALVIALAAFHAYEAAAINPYNISYFNQLAGGPEKGYTHLSDTDVDWGQWLKYLEKYASENNIGHIILTPPLPAVYTRNYIDDYEIAGCTPKNGIYAVGVSSITLYSRECYNWLRNYEPARKIAYSVLIYNITGV